MIVRLEGEVNGQPLIFQKKGGDRWESTIPSSLDGIYIVDLTAVDDAGNIGHSSRYILAIDLTKLTVKLRLCQYFGEIVENYSLGIAEGFSADIVDYGVNAEPIPDKFYASASAGR